ncbi:MAG: AMP-binding protein [Microthrixaceae bacterium]
MTAPAEWSFVAVNDVVADAVGDREMLVCGSDRRTYAEVRRRSRALARYLLDRGVGAHRERDELRNWEIGQDAVALVLHNGVEYLEAMYGAFRARAVPFNVNQHYRSAEVAGLLGEVRPRAVIHHRAYGPLVESGCDTSSVVLIDIDDGSGVAPLAGSVPYEDIVAADGDALAADLPVPSPDDLYMVCTGGTTGRPKAVLWRQADAYVGAMAGSEDATAESIRNGALGWSGGPWYAVPPLMHAAAQWTAFSALHLGATVLTHDDSGPFDAAAVLALAEDEGAFMMSIVGDAYARPMVEQLRRRPHDLSGLVLIGTGGAATSPDLKDALVELVPNLIIRDGYGASETGGMAFGAHTPGATQVEFAPGAGASVLDEDRIRFLEPGEDELGWIARRGRVPLGYLGDPERTTATFPTIGTERVAVPGDRGRLREDGTIVLVGRDSLVVNTGGEKVFVEEVEAVLRSHPRVQDALVVGRPCERFGNETVALVAPEPDARVDPFELREFVAARLARFKAPRAVALCERIPRLANGKGDYVWAAEAAAHAEPVVGTR